MRRGCATTATRSPRAPGWCSTPTSPRRRWRGCASTSPATVSSPRPTRGCCTGSCGAFVTDARRRAGRSCSTSTTSSGPPELLDALRARRRADCRELVACDEVVGTTSAFGGDAAGRRAHRRPAGGAARAGLPRAGDGQVHVRHRSVPARRDRARSAPRSHAGPHDVGRLAAARRRRRTASTARSTPRPRRCAGSSTSACSTAPTQSTRRAQRDSDGVLFVPALAGLAAPWWDSDATASFTGMTLEHHPRPPRRARVLRGHRGPGRRPARRRRGRPRRAGDRGCASTAGSPARRVLMQAQADLAQVPVDVYPCADATALGARPRARRRARPERDAWPSVVGGWSPARTYEPQWSADRAPRPPRPLASTRSTPASPAGARMSTPARGRRRRRRRRRRRLRGRPRARRATDGAPSWR